MKKLAAPVLLSIFFLAACSSGPDPDRELTLQERDNLIVACYSATKDEVYEVGGYGGDWQQYSEWDLIGQEIANDQQIFLTSGYFDSDTTGEIPISCEIELNLDTLEAVELSHEVSPPVIDYREIALNACYDKVLEEVAFPAGVEFVETVDVSPASIVEGGARSFTFAGDVDVPNAFGTLQRQGFLCLGQMVEENGDIRLSQAIVADYLRGAYTDK